ncbi:MAG: HAMP domain-containing histidine kinase [Bacteroidaceae bacterium]|nr:HAMP domain-containing histidine kinase [Bacteroidaceae bacterium]
MKKSTISILAIVMGISFLSLLGLQLRYIHEIMDLRHQHLQESVSRSLYEVAHQLELDEATRYIEQGSASIKDMDSNTSDPSIAKPIPQLPQQGSHPSSTIEATTHTSLSDKYFTRNIDPNSEKMRSLKEIIDKRFAYEKALVDEVIYSIIFTASDKPLEERIDYTRLDQLLKNQLVSNGIGELDYHFCVLTNNGRVIYKCADYNPEGEDQSFSETLFKNDPVQRMGTLKVHFSNLSQKVNSDLWFILPSLGFTLVVLITFIVTLVLIFRNKRVSEMRNDFINNMTHEFKTPISSISLAAQMLNDASVKKTPQMMTRLTTTIMDETKRLRFQVEKVLQLSLHENQKANLHPQDTDANELISGVVHTFALKVEKNGGKIITHLEAYNPFVYVDEMHFTNVIFNLMDNAVKYKRDDIQLELNVRTWNEDKRLCISIEDNGIGIDKSDLKRIFEKFYRVHTGNLHNVKGFGLGLAYVNKIIRDHKGTIVAESELGIGTKFIIKLPLSEDE